MKKLLLFVSVLLFATVAVAQSQPLLKPYQTLMGEPLLVAQSTTPAVAVQTCDLNMSLSMSFKDQVKLKNAVTYVAMTPAEAQAINTRSQEVLNVASKGQDKGGDYTFNFDGNGCGLTVVPIVTPGLSHKDAMKVLRSAFVTVAEKHIQASEQHVKDGHKGPWGKD
jgi:hypothetical protein